jgi:hypothetical protein
MVGSTPFVSTKSTHRERVGHQSQLAAVVRLLHADARQHLLQAGVLLVQGGRLGDGVKSSSKGGVRRSKGPLSGVIPGGPAGTWRQGISPTRFFVLLLVMLLLQQPALQGRQLCKADVQHDNAC